MGLIPGRFHSPKNEGFVGVVDGACLPPHRPFSFISGIGATGRGIAPTKNETALGAGGDLWV